MWCYQKPGFQALLLTELQRQQQCRHFCDTMLTTEDISVPAHSCVLSAISPHIASALSSTPSPPPGQSRLLEFQALGACTLLRVVRLMYSGEMVGEGETERQEAVSAAAKLGIHGLVEVATKKGENSQWVEVGVQTEPLQKEKGQVRWVTDVRDGSTIMWKEKLSDGIKDMWTQTEQLQLNTIAPELTFETIDMSCLQNLSHTNSSAIPPQIPFVPISLLYPPNEHPNPPLSCAPVASSQESTAAGPSSAGLDPPPSFSSLFSREITSFVHPQSRRSSSQAAAAAAAAAANEWDDSSFEQFKGNISGYINDFLNPERQKKRRGRPRGRRQNSGAGGTRRARAGGRLRQRLGRGGFTETVDVQEVGLSTVQKVFLQRCSTRSSRTGQGGGAAGRKLYVKTREQLPKRRGGGPERMGKVSLNKREPPSRAVTQDEDPLSSAKERPADGFQSPPSQFCNRRTAPASTPSLQPSPSPGWRSSTGSHVSPVSSFLHNAAVPPPPQDEQVEQIDRLLEEVMMGLDIFPNSSAQPAPPAGGGSCTYPVSSSAESRQHGLAFVKGGGRSGTATSRAAAPQPRGEAELGDMLENFLSTFEREIRGCNPAGEERVGRSQTRAFAGSSQAATQQLARTKTAISSRLRMASASNAARAKSGESRKTSVSQKPRKRRRRKEQKPSQQTLKDLVLPSEPNIRKLEKQENQQLKQMPVVKLGRRGPLPDRMILQGKGLPDLNGNNKIGKIESSCGRCASAGKSQSMWTGKKMYPIRSKLKDACAGGTLLLEQPLKQHRRVRRGRNSGPQNGSVLDLSGNVQPAEQLQKVDDEPEEDATSVQPQEHAREAPRPVSRRRAEVEEQKSEDDASGSKRLCLGQPSHTTTPVTPRPQGLREAEEVIDVETLSEGSQEDKPEWRERSSGELDNDSCDEIIVVDGDEEDDGFDPLGGPSLVTHQTSIPGPESLRCRDEEEEEEEEEIDVVSDQSPQPSTAVSAAVR